MYKKSQKPDLICGPLLLRPYYTKSKSENHFHGGVRKTIGSDVGYIQRLFDFLEDWGLINYAGLTKPQLKWEEKETKLTAAAVAQCSGNATAGGVGADASVSKKRICSGRKTPCTIACFAFEKKVLCSE